MTQEGTQEEEVEEIPTIDGLEWLEACAAGHVFRPLNSAGTSALSAHRNNNLSLTVKQRIALRFVREKDARVFEVLQLDAGVQVLVYRPYKQAAYGESVATFFVSDTRQVTLLRGGALRVRTREY